MIPYVIVNGATAANLTSPAVDLGDLQVYGIEVLVTGSDVVGTFTLEASNTKNAWVTISGSSQARHSARLRSGLAKGMSSSISSNPLPPV
jgi:hypothetical protein